MRRREKTETRWALLFVALSAQFSGGARAADERTAIDITYFTRVSQGQQPKVSIRAREAVSRVEVQLKQTGGERPLGKVFGNVGRGQTVDVLLPGQVGTRHYEGKVIVRQGGVVSESAVAFDVVVAPPLQILVDKSEVDLAARKLSLQVSRAPATVAIVVHASDGSRLDESEHDVSGAKALQKVTVGWSGAGEVGRIDVKVTDVDGYFAGLSLFPWSVYIPHEEVNFAVDSADIAAAERPKLQVSLQKISEALRRHRDLGPIALFIAGHTDTQGKAPYNVALSLKRARAIATHFRKNGLRIPIAYEGFGEHALLVATPDETDEVRNRRVDYILAIEPPQLRAGGFSAQWKKL